MNKEIIEKWLNGTLSDEERRSFEGSEDFRKIQRILKKSEDFRAPGYDVEAELQKFQEAHMNKSNVVRVNWFTPVLRIAAAFALVAVAWWFFNRTDTIEYQTAYGEKLEVILPDSSVMVLNANSVASLDPDQWTNERSLELNGEAYFKVKKGSRFEVSSMQGTVSVLGTQFNVKSREKYFEVICYEGKVGVETPNHSLKLEQNDFFRLINDQKTEDKHPFTSPSWVANESRFSSVPFYEVLDELERQYGVAFTRKDVPADELFSGGFTHENLELALKSITLPMNIRYEIVDDQTIILTGELD